MVTPAAAIRKAKKSLDKENLPMSAEALLHFYKQMVLIRRFEEKTAQLYGMGLIGGFCHLYIGQEAVIVGMHESVKKGDQLTTTYRDHAHMLVCDTPPVDIFAELMGRADGCSRGKGGSMHMFDVKNHFYGGHGIVGASVPIATGLGFANKYRGNDNISFAYFGDGATNQGQVYESFNMAALWKLPVVFVIENNEYAMGTSAARSTAFTELYRRGEAFGVPGLQVNGMDVLEVRKAAHQATEHIKAGNGPIILEMKTYRYRGHSMSDPAQYRSREEVTNIRQTNDPISNLEKVILAKDYATEAQLKEIDKEIKESINAAAELAKTSPQPDAGELFTDILVGE